jgi:hypothetical protein
MWLFEQQAIIERFVADDDSSIQGQDKLEQRQPQAKSA